MKASLVPSVITGIWPAFICLLKIILKTRLLHKYLRHINMFYILSLNYTPVLYIYIYIFLVDFFICKLYTLFGLCIFIACLYINNCNKWCGKCVLVCVCVYIYLCLRKHDFMRMYVSLYFGKLRGWNKKRWKLQKRR